MNGMPCLSRISKQEAKASGDGAPGFQFKQTATGSCRRCGGVQPQNRGRPRRSPFNRHAPL